MEAPVIRAGTVALFFALGCTGPIEGETDGLRTLSASATTNNDGLATVSFDVDGEDAMLLTVQPDDPNLAYFSKLTDPNGTVVFDAESLWQDSRSVSGGAYPDSVVSLNWPALPGADPLQTGRWTAEIGVVDTDYYYVGGAGVTFDGELKVDGTFASGELDADVIYTGQTGSDPEIVAAIEDAVEYWKDLYAQIGLDLVVEYWDYPDLDSIAKPGYGNAADYVSMADMTPFRAVNVVITEEIENGSGLFGIAGGIPGPLVSTGNSGVAVSSTMHSGPDLRFDDGEIGVLGETLAHETGHFLGLFHPVEATYDLWDSLDDTPECSTENGCIEALGQNLMYPYPICDQSSCWPQDELTDDQGDVANQYTAAR